MEVTSVFTLQTTTHTLHVRFFMFLGLSTEEQRFVRSSISEGHRFKRLQIGCNIYQDVASLVRKGLPLCVGLVLIPYFLVCRVLWWGYWVLGFFWGGGFLSRLHVRSWCWKLSFFLFSTSIYTSSYVTDHISLRCFWFGLHVWWYNTLSFLSSLLAGSVMIFSCKNHFINQIL